MPQREDWPGGRAFEKCLVPFRFFPTFPTGVAIVTEASSDGKTPTKPEAAPRALDPFKNPSYPQRTHLLEREALEASLRSCEERLRTVQPKLAALGSDPRRGEFERTYHQMLGARDQIAETVRRLPLETGELYDEDKERFAQAVQAFDRVWRRWEGAGK
jgi:hypothetical protein